MPAEDVEVRAVWVAGKYNTTIKNGGEGAEATPALAGYMEMVMLDPGTRTGYTFAGWTSSVTITDNKFSMPVNGVEVTATWTAIPYTINVNDSTGGSGSEASPNPVSIGQTVTLHRGTPATGYEADGWLLNGTALFGTSFSMPAKAVEVIATWKLKTYAVTLITSTEVKLRQRQGRLNTEIRWVNQASRHVKATPLTAGTKSIGCNGKLEHQHLHRNVQLLRRLFGFSSVG